MAQDERALLVREWNGRLERVMILDDGCAWNGCVYRSLSQVAKAITGTNWNGHRFFGLKAVRTGASNRKRNVTPRPDSLLDIGVSPTLAGFAPAMPDRSPPLATKESDSASPNESAWRHSCEGECETNVEFVMASGEMTDDQFLDFNRRFSNPHSSDGLRGGRP